MSIEERQELVEALKITLDNISLNINEFDGDLTDDQLKKISVFLGSTEKILEQC